MSPRLRKPAGWWRLQCCKGRHDSHVLVDSSGSGKCGRFDWGCHVGSAEHEPRVLRVNLAENSELVRQKCTFLRKNKVISGEMRL